MDETKDLSSEFLNSSQIDNALIRLKEKEIAEQIRSNKVVEGILKDISHGLFSLNKESIEGF